MMLNFLQVQRLTYMYYATIGYKTLYGSYLQGSTLTFDITCHCGK